MKFTEKDLKDAIEKGIFDKNNNVTASSSQVIRYFEKWAELKAKEVHRDVRHEAASIVCKSISEDTIGLADSEIMKIQLKND